MRLAKALLLSLFISTNAFGAISLVGVSSQPADGGTYSTDPLTITPPGGMAVNDYVVVWLCARANVSWTNSNNGGQGTWSSSSAVGTSARGCQVWHVRYTTTWTADPAFDASNTPNTHTAYMMVFRGVDATTALDSAIAINLYEVGDITAGSVTINPPNNTATANAWQIYCWMTNVGAAWVMTGSNLTQSNAQIVNLAGLDTSVSCGWKNVPSVGDPGDEANVQQAGFGQNDPGAWATLALKPSPNVADQNNLFN